MAVANSEAHVPQQVLLEDALEVNEGTKTPPQERLAFAASLVGSLATSIVGAVYAKYPESPIAQPEVLAVSVTATSLMMAGYSRAVFRRFGRNRYNESEVIEGES